MSTDSTPPRTRAPRRPAPLERELVVAGFAVLALLAAQWMLSRAIHGTNYYGGDGKMAQAITLAAQKFAGILDVTNLSPIMGVGSQMLPKNVWANPSLWPFAFVDTQLATDLSALVALAVFAVACYVMARCFDVPVVPSAIAAQLTIVLFAPVLLLVYMPTNFCLTPADAVVYAPYMAMLGLLARLEPTSWRLFGLTTGGLLALLLYSIWCDPLFTFLAIAGWAVPFAVVTLGPLRLRTILLRGAALGTCGGVLLVSGVAGYLYTLSRYTARVQFAATVDRPRGMAYASAVTYSSNMKYFYLICAVGWILGLLAARGRTRLLPLAAAVSFCLYLGYVVVYLLQNGPWVPPIPIYIEQCLFPLYLTAAVAGSWTAIRAGALGAWRVLAPRAAATAVAGTRWPPRAGLVVAGFLVAIIPGVVIEFARHGAEPLAELYDIPWPDEPEAIGFFVDNIGQAVGASVRGSVHFETFGEDTAPTIAALWARRVPTIAEYSQLVTPQAFYFEHKVFDQNVTGSLNGFVPKPGESGDRFWRALQMFGTRYYVASDPRVIPAGHGGDTVLLPHRPHRGKPGSWHIVVLPRPNVGDYSPIEVTTGGSASEIVAKMRAPGFDFTRQAVLSAPVGGSLVAARDVRLSRQRGALHLSAHSEGTSLVVLPQQFSNCLRARDARVRLVRTNLMMTGVIFSGSVDTDIVFDYGLFSPGCRMIDLADMKRLDLKIDLRMPHLRPGPRFPDWPSAVATLRAAAAAIR